jgi:hypothetical protein
MIESSAQTHKLRSDVLCYLRSLPALFADTHHDSRPAIGMAALQLGKFLEWHRGWLEPLGSAPIPGIEPDEPQSIHQLSAQLKQLGLEMLTGQHRTTTDERLERLTAQIQNLSVQITALQDESDMRKGVGA